MSMIGGEMLPDIEVARYALRTFKRVSLPTHDVMGPVAIAQWLENLYFPHATLARAWEGGTCTAVCAKEMLVNGYGDGVIPWMDIPENHTTPHLKCTCGIYGCLTLAHLALQYPTHVRSMVAVIAAEGTTILGDNGLRTQYARVVAWWVGMTAPDCFRPLCQKQFGEATEFKDLREMRDAYDLNKRQNELELRPGYPIMRIPK